MINDKLMRIKSVRITTNEVIKVIYGRLVKVESSIDALNTKRGNRKNA